MVFVVFCALLGLFKDNHPLYLDSISLRLSSRYAIRIFPGLRLQYFNQTQRGWREIGAFAINDRGGTHEGKFPYRQFNQWVPQRSLTQKLSSFNAKVFGIRDSLQSYRRRVGLQRN